MVDTATGPAVPFPFPAPLKGRGERVIDRCVCEVATPFALAH